MSVFHGGQFTKVTCSDIHGDCRELPDASEKHESQSNLPEDKNEFCPVVLFSQGVTSTDGFAIQLPERLAAIESIAGEPDAVWTSCLKGKVQARAPPAG